MTTTYSIESVIAERFSTMLCILMGKSQFLYNDFVENHWVLHHLQGRLRIVWYPSASSNFIWCFDGPSGAFFFELGNTGGSIYYQPKQGTIKGKSLKLYHSLALCDSPQMVLKLGNLMILGIFVPFCFPKKLVLLLFSGFLWVAMAILSFFKGGELGQFRKGTLQKG